MQVDRKQIEASLRAKGFVAREGDHLYFHHEHEGKWTGAETKTSHGSGYKAYGVALLKLMKLQLKLDTIRQVYDLCTCPLSAEEYVEILRKRGLLA